MIAQIGWDYKTDSSGEATTTLQGKREEMDAKRGGEDSGKSSSTRSSNTEEVPGCASIHPHGESDEAMTVFMTTACDGRVTNISSSEVCSLSSTDDLPSPIDSGMCTDSKGGVDPDVDLLARLTAPDRLSIPSRRGGGRGRQGGITYDPVSADRGSTEALNGKLTLHIISSADAFEPVLRVASSLEPVLKVAAAQTSPIPERLRTTENLGLSRGDSPSSGEGILMTSEVPTADNVQCPDFIEAVSLSKDDACSSGGEADGPFGMLLESKATLRKPLDERSLYPRRAEVSGSAILLEPGAILVSDVIMDCPC